MVHIDGQNIRELNQNLVLRSFKLNATQMDIIGYDLYIINVKHNIKGCSDFSYFYLVYSYT